MKVTLKLNTGAFYFLKNVHLHRGVPTEVDLTQVEASELAGLKLYAKSGAILADKDFQDFEVEPTPIEATLIAAVEPEAPKGEAVEDVPEKEDVPQEEDTPKGEDLSKLSNRELKAKLEELGVEPKSNRKDDLVEQLTEALAAKE